VGRHIARRDPRAHWLLLVFVLAVLFAALSFNGSVHHIGGGPGRPGHPATAVAAPAGPLVALADGQLTGRGMPAGTVALTFDDGPDPVWTPRILDLLRRYGVHATFFVVGSRVNDHPELVRRMVAEGHTVGSHSYTHADLGSLPAWRRRMELRLTRTAIAGATGQVPVLFRPPYSSTPGALGTDDLAVVADAARTGQLTVLSDLDSGDWRRPGVEEIVRAATPRAGTGAVVLMHDGGGDRSQTLAALDRLLPALAARGYRFDTVGGGAGIVGTVPAGLGDRLRGDTVRYSQRAAGDLASTLDALLILFLALALVRLVVQVVGAGAHRRNVRRRYRQPPGPPATVSVIVPAFNESANIAATVRSLVASDHPRLEVIVVDDGSSDGTADLVERLRLPRVQVVRQANGGKPAALNTGIGRACGDVLVLLDGDTVFQADTIGHLVRAFADPTVGAVSGNAKVAGRRTLLGRWQHLEYVIGFNLDRRLFDLARCMPTIPGAVGAFRREVLRDVGGVPSDTLAEDTDLTMAVLRAGWRVVYEPRAVAWTEAPATLRQLWRQRYRWCYGTMQAAWKHRRAIGEPGPAGGALGRRGLPYLFLFQFLLPLVAPVLDVLAGYAVLFLPRLPVLAAWLGLLAVQALTAGYALRLEREPYGALWTLPLQQVVYRQFMYLVVIQSVVTALTGNRLRWHRMHRTGDAAALLTARAAPARSPGR
jgi:cellulose synthase/poly-beta-1,6-N-acetylglucosamine synthase-like glycosyltransferase/peptidoglycan/xylan/chitin deacetylase (PgdA/CDA1 family)